MEGLKLMNASLEEAQNHVWHKTEGLNSTSLVVRRGEPFKITLSFSGPYMLSKDHLMLRTELDCLYCDIPITSSKATSQSQWSAYFQQGMLDPSAPHKASLYVYSPPTAIVGVYQLHLLFMSRNGSHSCRVGQFTLLCNPWCTDDAVYLPKENQREEYVRNDFGLLYQGTAKNIIFRPWGFDQYESGILEICMMLLQVSNEHKKNQKSDYANRADPVYISRVISAMINSNDDCGVLQGNWSENYSNGVNPSEWTGSGSILKQWAKSGYRPVKYGQCWVFAAVMCTVMRVLGIPTRVVTNYNSAHDTNGNLVIEEYYTEKGEKLPRNRESIWNFHVWVECWMKRRDLKAGFDGWQVVDPTPQEKSGEVYRCGPAPVKAIQERQLDMAYDAPFVYAEVNADVYVYIVRQTQVLGYTIETDRVGSLICTKSMGSNRPQDITSSYKNTKALQPSVRSTSPMPGPTLANNHGSAEGLSVELSLIRVPVVGENISFSVTVTNRGNIMKTVREYVNAQAKCYDHSPSDTFWEADSIIQLAPHRSKVLQHQISYSQYSALGNEQLVNLAAVIMDVATQERVLASEEFNFASPVIHIQVADEDAIIARRHQVAMVTFTNPFSVAVRGMLTVAGSGLLEDKVLINVALLQPRETMNNVVRFTPKMVGVKMLHASLRLDISHTVIRGFRTITVQPA
ncbi:transglutaminase 5, like [Ictalurus punctatus]|uniref:protein-glutamine gamma-glutamyltransferase n=1 Tax=Ictalurus punctatus TaxID=7998 RepID=A0A2D0RYJ5_ICTPU|nr:transglutaminase 5, like [Ictalurus punctatus]XP_017335578.1 transglutaminase 5, like [Ictalurus punctatus]